MDKETIDLALLKMFNIVFPYKINEQTQEVICFSWSDPAKEICRVTFELILAVNVMK